MTWCWKAIIFMSSMIRNERWPDATPAIVAFGGCARVGAPSPDSSVARQGRLRPPLSLRSNDLVSCVSARPGCPNPFHAAPLTNILT